MPEVTLEGRALPIYPARSDDKSPACQHGWKDASTDPTEIKRLWHGRSGLLTAVPTGKASGLAVLDIDPKHDGEAWLAEFEATHGSDIFRTRCHATRSGGLHFVYQHRHGLESPEGLIAPGVDIRGDKGAVIWWPASGFRVLSEGPVMPWPAALDAALAEAEERKRLRFRVICEQQGSSAPDGNGLITPALLPPDVPVAYEINYAERSLQNACEELRNGRGGDRNRLLNALAYKLGRQVVRGWIKREWVEKCLWWACKDCGLLDDPEDGPEKTRDTLVRAITAGMLVPYTDIRWRVTGPTQHWEERAGVNSAGEG
jgi:hypothetical protein